MDTTLKTVRQCKKELISAVRGEKNAAGSEWLCDNAVILLECLNAYTALRRKHGKTAFARLFDFCLTETGNGLSASKESLCAAFKGYQPSADECEGLFTVLKAAYAVTAVKERGSENTVSFCVRAIKALSNVSPDEILPEISETEKLLCKDPAGVYPFMSAYSKSLYRKAVKKLAAENGISEKEAAADALQKALNSENGKEDHIGFYLPLNVKNRLAVPYLALEILVSVLLCFTASAAAKSILVFFLLLFPVYSFVRVISGLIAPRLFPPRQMLSLDEEAEGVYLPGAVITVSSLLPDAKNAKNEYAHLAALRSSDSSSDTAVLALFDLKNARTPSVSSDKADINAMKEIIDRLNLDFGGGFIMAVRDRVYSPTENEYTGAERKRGAMKTLVKLLCENENGFSVLHGDTAKLKNKNHILALDSDTELSFEVLHRLMCIACHPMNKAVYDPAKRRITGGYGCIVPRTETSLSSSCKTLFSTIFTSGGATAYSPAVSERYMDMFSVSLFTGKGLIDAQAYLKVCADAFDDGRILSHDIPEGALLRTGFAGNAVLTDSFPSSPASYFRRAQRWIRGDIQNAPLIFRGTSRSKASAKLPPLAGYQLADNIRIAVTPVSCLICLFASAFSGGLSGAVLLSAAILGVSGDGLISCFKAILSGGFSGMLRTFFSSSVSQGLRSLMRAVFTLGALPQNAAVSADAAVRAMYRMFISKKHTLQWTTASDSEKQGGKNLVFSLFFPLFCAFSLIFLSVKTAVPGFAILLCIPFCLSDGIRLKNRRKAISESSREVLTSYMSSMWDFFAENVNDAENHLPPDNIQETPVRRTAHRTSPTNIGLYLVSALAAADMSFISENELFDRISATLGTLSSMIKYKGLLYNWYDTKTLMPLKPHFVSTVDCGNFEVCLTALKEGLKEYARVDKRFDLLTAEIDRLLSAGDLTELYDKKRGLFSVGLDVSSSRLSDSFYDLFMSEAVMTSYYHIAKRDVPVSHWGKLDRPLIKAGRYTAAVSWTGTMFEYFMPALFLPLYENSFRYEALKVCLNEQKAFAGAKQPYGVSESGYYAFDPQLSYRYRANGIRRLALKRNADCGRIFSPYSSFLALAADPEGAVKNLSKFAALHALGRYGFYEAVDFESAKNAPQDYMLVRSYMAHHVGMSIIACANAVNGNSFVKRFMNDREISSGDSLLHEKIPFDSVPSAQLFRSKMKKELPSRGGSSNAEAPDTGAAIFSNGEDSLICSAFGEQKFIRSSVSVLGFNSRVKGVFAGICADGKNVVPLAGAKGELRDTCFYYKTEINGVTVQFAPALMNNFSVLAVPVKLKNGGADTVRLSLLYYFEPELLPASEFPEHPAFEALTLRAGFDERMKALTFEQKSAKRQRAAFAAGFYDCSSFLFECDREKAPGRNIFRSHPFDGGIPRFENNVYCVYPCAAIRLDIEIKAGKTCEKVLLISADENAESALGQLARIRLSELPDLRKAAPRLIKAPAFADASAEEFAARVFFGAKTEEQKKALSENRLPVSALWQAGISGDLPLITVLADGLPEAAYDSVLRLHNALAVTGTANDLVFVSSMRGDFYNGAPAVLKECIRRADCADTQGKRGGVHILCAAEYGESFFTLLKAVPGLFFPRETEEKTRIPEKTSEKVRMSKPAGSGENCFVPNGYHIGTKGSRPWCHTLSNSSFGTLLSDSALGYTWALNSRQNKLTPWSNDVCSDLGGEKLYIKVGDAIYDAVSGADVTFYDDKAVYTSVCGDVNVRITVQTDARAMKKRLTVKLSGIKAPGVSVTFSVKAQLAESEKLARYVRRIPAPDCLILTNPANTDYGGFAGFYASESFETAEMDGVFDITVKPEGAESEISFYTVFSRSLKGVRALMELPFREPLPERVRVTGYSQETNAFGSALLLHNVYDTRVKARTGFYQCSGAYGFRDQLQDVCALLPYYPEAAKRQLLRSCAVQFGEGDVLHWYHTVPFPEPCFKGVRTHCSDDLLWLPLAAADYLKVTGDLALMNTPVAFLKGEILGKDERERYGSYKSSGEYAGVYEHCVRAIKHSLDFGAHSLPLIKAGDWNDSFSEVGTRFVGESVWLAEFLRLICLRFIPVSEKMKDEKTKLLLLETADKMKNAVLKHGFNGKYFIRGYYDDGSKLGDETSRACKIDLLPQAFAALADIGSEKQLAGAFSYAMRTLYDAETGTLKLFDPPFTDETERAGYVNDYPAGVRENGGQYTHAAVWFALALKKAGYVKEAEKLCMELCPANRYKDEKNASAFMNEPYAMTGDICTGAGINGRGGWSLYTGSAGWYLRLLLETGRGG